VLDPLDCVLDEEQLVLPEVVGHQRPCLVVVLVEELHFGLEVFVLVEVNLNAVKFVLLNLYQLVLHCQNVVLDGLDQEFDYFLLRLVLDVPQHEFAHDCNVGDAVEGVFVHKCVGVVEERGEDLDEMLHVHVEDGLASELGDGLGVLLELVHDAALLLGLPDQPLDVVQETFVQQPAALGEAAHGRLASLAVHNDCALRTLAFGLTLLELVQLFELILQVDLGILLAAGVLLVFGPVGFLVLLGVLEFAHVLGEVLPGILEVEQLAHLDLVDGDDDLVL